MTRELVRRFALAALKGALLTGPALFVTLMSGAPITTGQDAHPRTVAIDTILEASGSPCFVLMTSTYDPLWLDETLEKAKAQEGWIVEDIAWAGGVSAVAAGVFGGAPLGGDGASTWVLAPDAQGPRAIQLRQYQLEERSVWILGDTIRPAADCKDNEF